MSKSIFLTIDDAPSIHFRKKIDFLKEQNIFALFYVRGEYIEKHIDSVVYAVENGFLLGNHSYSHPYFSKISMKEIEEEIIKTEELIKSCYEKAGVTRPVKCIRLPFGDRGKAKQKQVQNFLKDAGFTRVVFGKNTDPLIDSLWDIDTKDYKKKFIENEHLFLQYLKGCYEETKCKDIWMAHDFDHQHHLFLAMMDFFLKEKVEFLTPTF